MEIEKLTIEQKKSIEYPVKTIGEISIKDVDLDKRVVTGFYNSYNFFDSDADVLLMGSSKKSIDNHGPSSSAVRKIKHALNHDLKTLPGKIQVLEEKRMDDISGVYFETRMAKTTLGTDTLINYQEGIYDNHSIGFRYLDMEYVDSESDNWEKYLDLLINPEDAEKYGFMYAIKEIELFEGSTVAIGANQLTPYLGVKSGDPDLYKIKLNEKLSNIERQLKKGKQSDEMLYDFSIQIRQIKQMINELDGIKKPTPKQGPGNQKKSFEDLLKNAKFI